MTLKVVFKKCYHIRYIHSKFSEDQTKTVRFSEIERTCRPTAMVVPTVRPSILTGV